MNPFIKFYSFFSKHIYVFFVLLAILSIALLLSFLRLSFYENITGFLPDKMKFTKDFKEVAKTYHALDNLIININIENARPEEIIELGDILNRRLNNNSMFTDLNIIYGKRNSTISDFKRIFINRLPALIDRQDLAYMKKFIDPSFTRTHFKDLFIKLLSPGGFIYKNKIQNDPLSLQERIFQRLREYNIDMKFTTYNGKLFSTDLNHLLVIIQPKIPSSNSAYAAKLVKAINKVCRDAEVEFKEYNNKEYKINFYITGGYVSAFDNAKGLKRDIQITVNIAIIAIIFLFIFLFKSKIPLFLTLVSIGFGTLFSLGILGLIKESISVISIGMGAVLINISIDYPIHFFYNYESLEKSRAIKTIKAIIIPMLMGVLTTSFAFLSLQLSVVPGQRDIGLFSTFGILGTFIFTAFFLSVITEFAEKKVSPIKQKKKKPLLFIKFFHFIEKQNNKIFTFSIIFTLIIIFFIPKLSFDGNIEHLNGLSKTTKIAESIFNEKFGNPKGRTTAVIKASKKNSISILLKNDIFTDYLKELKTHGKIKDFSSISSLFPSKKRQEKNIEMWNNFWKKNKGIIFNNFINAAKQYGIKANFFTFFNETEYTGSIITEKDMENTTFDNLILKRIKHQEDDCVLTIIEEIDNSPGAWIPNAKKKFPNSIIINRRLFVQDMVMMIKNDLQNIALYSLLAVFLILLLFYRDLRLLIITLIPLLISILWTFGIMGLTGLKFNIINIIVSIFIFGVGIDYGIFTVSSLRDRNENIDVSRSAVLMAAFTTIIGFGCLMLAKHPALFSVGLTVSIGIISALISTLSIVPFLYKKIYKTNQ